MQAPDSVSNSQMPEVCTGGKPLRNVRPGIHECGWLNCLPDPEGVPRSAVPSVIQKGTNALLRRDYDGARVDVLPDFWFVNGQ